MSRRSSTRCTAERAAAAGENTFAIPEAASAAAFIAAMVSPGPLRLEAEGWLDAGASYHALVRLAARSVTSLGADAATGPALYVPKAGGELEPLLKLWPAAIALPTVASFEPADLVMLRAFPVHPLGLVSEPTWADGRLASPAEFFFHDLDHARFKIREDLRVEGVEIPDAYEGGSTVDRRTGRHRSILPAAEGRLGSTLWDRADGRRELAGRLLAVASSFGGSRATAAELLLFEILHEKSHSLEIAVLARELASDAHVAKLRHKRASGFFGDWALGEETMAALGEARIELRRAL